MKKRSKLIIIISSVIFIILIIILCYFIFFKEKEIIHDVVFDIDEDVVTLEVHNDYEEKDFSLQVDNIDMTKDVLIDNSNFNKDVLGEYKIKYYIVLDDKEYSKYRIINVVDTTNPEIKLNGSESISILKNENYEELGYIALDNYDGDITDKVEVNSTLDSSKVGEYKITYNVVDSSNNSISVDRTIIVKEPKKIVIKSNQEEKETNKKIVSSNEESITANKFTNSGFYIEGNKKIHNDKYTLLLSGDTEYTFDINSSQDGSYKGNIDLSNVSNGSYKLYIDSETKEPVVNKMDFIDKIKRAKVANKLVTFDYSGDSTTIKIEDFNYLYDILIDPGHGGSDNGASNEYINEKEINLKVSLYEKCRYESHGYKVYMTRTTDTYGNGMGDSSLSRLHRRAYEVGYYGVVSKITYSNHHNAIDNKNFKGYEIIVPLSYTSSNLSNELEIMNKYNNIYKDLDNHMRFYGRDYDTEKKYNMTTGNTYTYKDNYAINRIPYRVFNTKAVIYEGSYLTNKEDYNWYWNEQNWIKVSEAKIETYINSIGGSYNSDNTSCLN